MDETKVRELSRIAQEHGAETFKFAVSLMAKDGFAKANDNDYLYVSTLALMTFVGAHIETAMQAAAHTRVIHNAPEAVDVYVGSLEHMSAKIAEMVAMAKKTGEALKR